MGVAQVGHGLPDGAHRAAVTARLGLGKDHTDVHALPVCPAAAQPDRSGRVT